MNMQQNQKRSRKKNGMNHSFCDKKLGWKKLNEAMNETSDIQYTSIMSIRGEFIDAMSKLAEHVIKEYMCLEDYDQKDIYNLATNSDFNEMIYEALRSKK